MNITARRQYRATNAPFPRSQCTNSLRLRSRSVAMGVFQTCNYALMAGLRALAGRLQDSIGRPSAPFWSAAA